jgi:hypothetical protein
MKSNWKKTLGLAIAIAFVNTSARAIPHDLGFSRSEEHESIHVSTWSVSHPIETSATSLRPDPFRKLLFPRVDIAPPKEDPHSSTGGADTGDSGSSSDTTTGTDGSDQGQDTVGAAGSGQETTGGVGSGQDTSAPLCKRTGDGDCTDEDASEAAPLDPAADAATAGNPDPITLNVDDLRKQLRANMDTLGASDDSDWVFWSGFYDENLMNNWVKDNPCTRKSKTFILGDILTKNMETDYLKPFQDAGKAWKFWAYISQAYAREVKGNAYVILPVDRPLDKPYANGKGSNFWSLELPELSRSGSINKITTLRKNGDVIDPNSIHNIWLPNWANNFEPYGVIGNPDVEPAQPSGPDITGPAKIST